MFENPRRGRQARNFTTNVPKILDLKSSSEQIFSRKLSLGAPASCPSRTLSLVLSLEDSDFVLSSYSFALFCASVNSFSSCSISLPSFLPLYRSPTREYSSERFSIPHIAFSRAVSSFRHSSCASIRLGGRSSSINGNNLCLAQVKLL